jgi:Geranylgeranyl pyrophosphate synthase
MKCPSEAEYLAMVDGSKILLFKRFHVKVYLLADMFKETAGLFRMLARMLDALSNSPRKPDVKVLIRFMSLLGRLFQIRDDYMNLTSSDVSQCISLDLFPANMQQKQKYTKQKGFCEDLDEGKFSLPLIHALGRCREKPDGTMRTNLICNLLSQRHSDGRLSKEQKNLILEQMRAGGSLEYTRRALHALQMELKILGKRMGLFENRQLGALLDKLKV